MTKEQEAAMRVLASALGVQDKKQITKEQAGKVLTEALDSMAGHRDHAMQAIIPSPAPSKDSELAKLHAYLSGTNDAAAREAAEQQRLDAAVAKALAAHTAADKPNVFGDLAEHVQKAFAAAAARITDDETEDQ